MLELHFTVGLHEQGRTLLAHVPQPFVPAMPLSKQRYGSLHRGTGLEQAVQASAFAGGSEQGEQGVSGDTEEHEVVTAFGEPERGPLQAHLVVRRQRPLDHAAVPSRQTRYLARLPRRNYRDLRWWRLWLARR
jgi:hypothetical protein